MLVARDEVPLLERVVFEVEYADDTPLMVLRDDLDVLVQRCTLGSVSDHGLVIGHKMW